MNKGTKRKSVDPSEVLMKGLREAFAKYERGLRAERIKSGIAMKRARIKA